MTNQLQWAMTICAIVLTLCPMAAGASNALAATTVAVGVDWDLGVGGVKNGILCGSAVTISSVFDGETTGDFSGVDFSFAPLPADQERLGYAASHEWTATFDPPVTDILLYAYFWRGASADGPDPVLYTFNQAFTIESGLAEGTISVNTLEVPRSGFHNGIIRFAGPVSSLELTTSATSTGAGQGATFGVLGDDSNANGVPDQCDTSIFEDDFEDATTAAWSSTVP